LKYWIDAEFVELSFTIDPIRVELVGEDGRKFYAESSEVDWTNASHSVGLIRRTCET
jgi:hypothetical protein